MTYIARYVFKGGDELSPEVPSPTPEEWDGFMDGLDRIERAKQEWNIFLGHVLEAVEREGSWEDWLQRETRPELSIQ